MARLLLGSSLSAALLLTGQVAQAQASWEDAPPPADAARPLPPPPPPRPEPSPSPPRGVISVRTEPPPPPVDSGRRTHDGFYLRLSSGLDFAASRVSFDGRPRLDLGGGGLAADVLVGGTPSRGLVLGGGIWAASIDEPQAKTDPGGYDPQGKLSYGLVGPFIDVFPSPRRGLHFGGGFGVGFLSLPNEPDQPHPRQALESFGGGGTLFGGYDFWVSSNWSLGGMLRVFAIRTRERSSLDYTATTRSLTLLFTAIYH
jgi:hypothetical protein